VIEEIVELSAVRRLEAGEVLIREGEPGRALYVVAEGEVEVVREGGQRGDGQEATEVLLAVLGKGSCLGEMSLLSGQPAAATVRARQLSKGAGSYPAGASAPGGAVMLALSREVFEDLLSRRGALHREFSRIIAERLYRTNVMLEAESGRGMGGRLSMIGVPDLIQALSASRRTGTLTLDNGRGGEARVGLREGSVSACVGSSTSGEPPPGPPAPGLSCPLPPGAGGGEEVFYEIVGWRDGHFGFEGGEPSAVEAVPGAAVSGDTMGLLMEGMRRLDERARS
jgi:CRP-like cAMP-binding protein